MDQRRRRDKANSEAFLASGQAEAKSDMGFAGIVTLTLLDKNGDKIL